MTHKHTISVLVTVEATFDLSSHKSEWQQGSEVIEDLDRSIRKAVLNDFHPRDVQVREIREYTDPEDENE